jgi:Tol biopolymer transport system component
LVFVWRGPDKKTQHIYLRDWGSGSVHRLTNQEPEENQPAWSPDGNQIAFVRLRADASKDVDVFSLRDGKERKLTELTGAFPWLCQIPRLSWSPDGKTLYSSASLTPNGACGIVAIDVQRGNVRRITQPPIGTVGDLEPAVAPDGSAIAFLRNAGTMGGDIFLVRLASGAVERLTFDNRDVMGFSWMPSGKALVLASRRDNGVSKLWRVELDGKKEVALTDGSMTAGFPSVTAGGNRIFFTAYRGSASIWKEQNGAIQKLVGSPGINYAPQLSPDGKRLVYRSDRTGAAELWMSRLDGSNDVRLTYFNGPMVGAPRWAPNGNSILFECRPRGHSDICLVNPDGQDKAQVLTHWSANQIFPSWSHDEKSFYFTSNDSGRWEIYRQAVGGEPVQLTHTGGMRAIESPGGDWLYISRGEPRGGIVRLALQESAGSAEKEILEPVTADVGPEESGNWDVSKDGVVFVSTVAGSTAVREVNGATGRVRQIGTLKQAPPQGDIVFSSSPQTGSIVFVKSESNDGEIDVLLRKPRKH